LTRQRALGHQIQLDRALRDVPQSEPDDFAEALSQLLQFRHVHPGIDLDVSERVEVIHRQIEFLLKELGGVGNDAAASAENNPKRSGAALLSAIELDGLVDLKMETGQYVPRHL